MQLDSPTFVGVVFDGIGDVERTARLDVACRCALSEGNTVHHVARFGIDEFQFDVLLLASYHLAGAEVIDIACAEKWFRIARTERRKPFQIVMQSFGDILEVNLCIDFKKGFRLFGLDMLIDILLETVTELHYIVPFQRQACSIGVSAEVQQQVATALDGCIDIESGNAACRTSSQIIIARQHDGRTEVDFRQS